MTKPTPKTGPQPGSASTMPPREDIQVAYQCHTLAQLVFAQLAVAYPWIAQTWQQPVQWPTTPSQRPRV